MIELKNVKKTYNGKVVFENVNLRFEEGSVTAFVGHNGCGKSTMLKVVSGLARKDCGEIICDRKYRFSYVPEKFPVINMTARQYLKYMLEIDEGQLSDENLKRLEDLVKDFFLEDMIDKPMKNLSKGTLQKIGVIQAFLSTPEVLLLDEPLSGLDAASQDIFVDKINELKRQGVIILLSAHEPDLINSIGDNVYTIEAARIVPYENKPQIRYVIWMPERGDIVPASDMKSVDNGYVVKCDEQTLHLEIKRLQREGWHIGKVYEDNSLN